MPELWDVYDAQRNRKPGSHVRGTLLAPGDFHLVVEIWTFTPDGRVLLTLRHPKKHFGGKWECTGGSVVQGEDSLTGARRELLEETGLSMAGLAPTLLTTLTVPANGTIYDIYAVRLDFALDDVTLQPGETVGKRFVDFDWLESPACAAELAAPVLERLRITLPLLRRFRDNAERWDMYALDGRFLGYNRLRPHGPAERQHPWEMSLAAIAFRQDACGKVLLEQRAPTKAAPLQWGCPGGGVSAGETPLQALLRETQEEVGLDLSSADPTPLNAFVLDGDYGKWCLHVYRARLPFALSDLTLQPEEVINVQLVPPADLPQHPLIQGIHARDPSLLTALLP